MARDAHNQARDGEKFRVIIGDLDTSNEVHLVDRKEYCRLMEVREKGKNFWNLQELKAFLEPAEPAPYMTA